MYICHPNVPKVVFLVFLGVLMLKLGPKQLFKSTVGYSVYFRISI